MNCSVLLSDANKDKELYKKIIDESKALDKKIKDYILKANTRCKADVIIMLAELNESNDIIEKCLLEIYTRRAALESVILQEISNIKN